MSEYIQLDIINKFNLGYNLFITGNAGCGKSYIVKTLVNKYKDIGNDEDSIVITSTTGISALNINGKTIHSWSGITPNTDYSNSEIFINELLNNHKKFNNWVYTKVLVIDEVSMLDADMLDFMNDVAKKIRNNSSPFGGIQIVVTGDFNQLPPVSNNKNIPYCFKAMCWNELIDFNIVLKKNYRQNEKSLIKFLNHIRHGKDTQFVKDEIIKYKNNPNYDDSTYTHLYPNRTNVEEYNFKQLNKLPGEIITIKATNSKKIKLPTDSIVCQDLLITVGAFVIVTKNIDLSKGLVNGRQGIVIEITKTYITIQTTDKQLHNITKSIWVFPAGNITQFPLRLAWALTIHKSQGMSIEYLSVDIGAGIFEAGQTYVALSRATSSEQLHIKNGDIKIISQNSEVKAFNKKCLILTKWYKYETDCGKIYYQNIHNDKTIWQLPKNGIIVEDDYEEPDICPKQYKKSKKIKVNPHDCCEICKNNKYLDEYEIWHDCKICIGCIGNNKEYKQLSKTELKKIFTQKDCLDNSLDKCMSKSERNCYGFRNIVYLVKNVREQYNKIDKLTIKPTSKKTKSGKELIERIINTCQKYFSGNIGISKIAKEYNVRTQTIEEYIYKAHIHKYYAFTEDNYKKLGINKVIKSKIIAIVDKWRIDENSKELPKLRYIKDNVSSDISYLIIKILI